MSMVTISPKKIKEMALVAAKKNIPFSKHHSSIRIRQSFSRADQVVLFFVSTEVNKFCFFEKMEKVSFVR